MKRIVVFAALMAFIAAPAAFGQFRTQSEPRVSDGLIQQQEAPSLFFGWFNPENFQMRHSVSFSYATMGGQGVSLGTYTNTMMYKIASNLDARADVSMSYSPFNSLNQFGGKKNDLSSIYLSNAQINYHPWDNVVVRLQYQQIPYGMYYSPFGYPLHGELGF